MLHFCLRKLNNGAVLTLDSWNKKSNLRCVEESKTSQLEAKLLARLTTAKFVSAQQATEDV